MTTDQPATDRPASTEGGAAPVAHFCPNCHQRVKKFKPGGVRSRPNAKCPRCGALERHRFLAVLLDGLGPVIGHAARVLDVAPSRYTTRHLDHLSPAHYVRMDLDPDADGRAVDVQASLTDLPFAPESFDLILCYHVLEHVPDDAPAMRELARVLKPGGTAIVQVPFRPNELTDEDPGADEDERIRRFGQADHVRWYGHDFEDRLGEAGLTGVRIHPADVIGEQLCAAFGVKEREAVWLLGPAQPGRPAGVARREAPGNGLLPGLLDLPGPTQQEEVAALKERVARLRDQRDRSRAQLARAQRQRDVWRARHERITKNPVVRAAAAPYLWVRKRRR